MVEVREGLKLSDRVLLERIHLIAEVPILEPLHLYSLLTKRTNSIQMRPAQVQLWPRVHMGKLHHSLLRKWVCLIHQQLPHQIQLQFKMAVKLNLRSSSPLNHLCLRLMPTSEQKWRLLRESQLPENSQMRLLKFLPLARGQARSEGAIAWRRNAYLYMPQTYLHHQKSIRVPSKRQRKTTLWKIIVQ